MSEHWPINRELWGGMELSPDLPEGEIPAADWADPQVAANAEALFKAWKAGGDNALKAKLLEIKQSPVRGGEGERR